MITSVQIAGFRGVREGGVEGLAPISILVGPNNSGKSTVLEAVAVVGNAHAPDEIARVLLRRGGPVFDALEHVVRHGESEATIEIGASSAAESSGWLTTIAVNAVFNVLGQGTQMQLTTTHRRLREKSAPTTRLVMTGKGQQQVLEQSNMQQPFPVSLVDIPGVRALEALEDAHTRIGKAGQIDLVVKSLQRAMSGLTNLSIFKSGTSFILHTVRGKERPVPAYLAGDGLKRFMALAAATLDTPNGVALIEEPETFQHPRYLQEIATLLHLAAREGTQILLATHSIELIDCLLHAPEAEGKAYPAVHRMTLHEGKLRATSLDRESALIARDDLLEDLRA